MKYKVYLLAPTSQTTEYVQNKINEKSLKLISTYVNRILGDDYLYGIFEEI